MPARDNGSAWRLVWIGIPIFAKALVRPDLWWIAFGILHVVA